MQVRIAHHQYPDPQYPEGKFFPQPCLGTSFLYATYEIYKITIGNQELGRKIGFPRGAWEPG
jgi:hypothetical protein